MSGRKPVVIRHANLDSQTRSSLAGLHETLRIQGYQYCTLKGHRHPFQNAPIDAVAIEGDVSVCEAVHAAARRVAARIAEAGRAWPVPGGVAAAANPRHFNVAGRVIEQLRRALTTLLLLILMVMMVVAVVVFCCRAPSSARCGLVLPACPWLDGGRCIHIFDEQRHV